MGVMGAPTDVPKNAKRTAAIGRMDDVDLEQKSVYPNEQQDALIYEQDDYSTKMHVCQLPNLPSDHA